MATLGDLFDHPDLGLVMLSGGESAFERTVAGCHSMEVGQPLSWLDPDWIMLTIGMRLRNSVKEQRRLIADSAEGGLAALGFGVGVIFDQVPKAMLKEAAQRDFPIFTVPIEIPFIAVIDAVNSCLISEHTAISQRSLSIQRYFMDTLSSPEPREDLVTRLSQVLQSNVGVFRFDGRILVQRGKFPIDKIWAEVLTREPREQDFSFDDMHIRSIPITISGGPTEWLVVASPGDRVQPILAREVVRSAASLLGLIGRARRAAVLDERSRRSQLLSRLADGEIEPIDIDRLRTFGIGVGGGVRVIAISPCKGADIDPNGLAEALESALARAHVPHLLMPDGLGVLVLAEENALDLDTLIRHIVGAGHDVVAGRGRVVTTAAAVAASAQDARVGATRLHRTGAAPASTAGIDEFSIAERLTNYSGSNLHDQCEQMLSPLREQPVMYNTLVTYLACNLNIKATAAALHLHTNSLRYRINRIEDILDCELDRVDAIVDLQLALLIAGQVDHQAYA